MALSSSELLALADSNLAECLREHARWSAAGIIDERAGTLRVVSNTRFAPGMFNAVVRTHEDTVDGPRWLAEQAAFYSAHGRGFSVYTRGEKDGAIAGACDAAGFEHGNDHPGMACREPIAEPPMDPHVQLEVSNTLASLQKVVSVTASSYVTMGLPESVQLKVMSEPQRLARPNVLWLLARYDGAPAATAMVLLSHSIAGIYWVATLPEYRGRGLGEACTRAATNAAFARGARAVVLQASQQGEPIYKRLGYREITRYPWFWIARPQ
jgi:hypothetical protein